MNENNPNTNPEIDPLAAPCGSTPPPEFPLLKEGLYNLSISKVEVKRNKADTGDTISITAKTTTDAYDTKGRPLNAGFPLYAYQGTSATDKKTISDVAKEIAQLMRALGLPGDMQMREFINNPTVAQDKIVVGKVTIGKATDEFPESNRVKFIEPKKG